MKMTMTAALVCAAATGIAFADTVDVRYTGIAGG